MTLTSFLHDDFGSFCIALEPTDHENIYKIKRYKPQLVSEMVLPANDLVTFTSYDHRYELPSPILLGVHAAIAKILHATGKGEEAERLLDKKDKIGVLASNGSTNVRTLLSLTNLAMRTVSDRTPTKKIHQQPKDKRKENVA
jgi:hypothetical protein